LTKGKLYDEQRDREELAPKPSSDAVPIMPTGLSSEEKKEWKFYRKALELYGLYTVAGAPMLELLCKAVVRFKTAAAEVADKGMLLRGKDGMPVKNPYYTVMKDEEKSIIKLQAEVGLSNTALARLGSLRLKANKDKAGMKKFFD